MEYELQSILDCLPGLELDKEVLSDDMVRTIARRVRKQRRAVVEKNFIDGSRWNPDGSHGAAISPYLDPATHGVMWAGAGRKGGISPLSPAMVKHFGRGWLQKPEAVEAFWKAVLQGAPYAEKLDSVLAQNGAAEQEV